MAAEITKLLVANRGEIAIRAFRAAVELGIDTVAIHTFEDRNSLHRVKADEAYQIGETGHPVRAYLDVEAIVATAVRSRADAIYPGYGFLSESPDLAEACADAGIVFVGPDARTLELTGNKMRARDAADAAGLPVLRQSAEIAGTEQALEVANSIGFPLFVKATAGGGGRGLRRVHRADYLAEAIASARREAESAFGDSTVFLEEAVTDARHIEVQVLGDGTEAVHLFERDCSVQRRFQKVVEIAPAPDLDAGKRTELCSDAVRFASHIGYKNAGTVEFLLSDDGRHVFIEMNPRIQVEHTVTEEVTDVDLVQAQLRIAGGASLADLGLTQDAISVRGTAVQCRVTAENPADDFRPDTGRIVVYRQPGGAGIRLDGGGGYVGADITPYFDSLIVKLTCRGHTFEAAVTRAQRALAEFRVRGIGTNLAFLQALLADRDFRRGGVKTNFLEDRQHLTHAAIGGDRATRLLLYIADITVNQPYGKAPTRIEPETKLPRDRTFVATGSKQLLDELGPDGLATWLRDRTSLAVTDTTLRDAHQSILATRLRTIDLVAGAGELARSLPGLFSLECWGGATFDVALRFLHEDPWDRLVRIRDAAPNVMLQMLLRGRNTVSYVASPDAVVARFVEEAKAAGIDLFRIFDALNNVDQMRPAIDAVLAVGGVAEGTLCYSGDLLGPSEDLYTLDYYLDIADQLVQTGVHILCIKDMAGLLRAPAARTLVTALRSRFDTPVHLHTHDTAGGQLATYLAAIDAGVDAVDGAAPPLSGMTSQPSLSAIIAATDSTDRETGLSVDSVGSMEPYWEAVRRVYGPFEAGLAAPTATVYRHEIPGGQLSNLRQQAIALGLGHRFEEVERLYAACDKVLGRPIKVTPSSKVVGDLALHLVASGVTPEELEQAPHLVDLPDSVIGFLHGELGIPAGGFPEPFRTRALAGRRERVAPREPTPEEVAALDGDDRRAALSAMLFSRPAAAQAEMGVRYGDLSVLPSTVFWFGLDVDDDDDIVIELEPGVRIIVGLEAIGEPDSDGRRSVVFRLNGQLRPIEIIDKSVSPTSTLTEKADPNHPGHIGAPFRGLINIVVSIGDRIQAGDTVATIEAMKMESTISTPIGGQVERVVIAPSASVEPGDLVLIVRPVGTPASPVTAQENAG